MRLLNALWMSFYSRAFYREVFEQWKGIGFLFLCLTALIQTIIFSTQVDAQWDVLVRDYAPAIVQQIPEITIRNGQASTPEAKEYTVQEVLKSKRLALIDTRLEEVPPNLGDTPLFVGKKYLLFQTYSPFTGKAGEPLIIPFTQSPNMVVDRPRIVSFLKLCSDWGAVWFSPITMAVKLISLILTVLFFSLFAWINFKSAAFKAGYPAILRVTAVSLSPATLISLITTTFFPMPDVTSFLYVLLAVCYISYACRAVKIPEESSGHNPEE
jgi:hypothetical protein